MSLIMILMGLTAFLAVAGVGFVLSGDDGGAAKKRMNSVAGVSTTRAGRGRRQVSALDQAASRRKQLQETLADLESKEKRRRKRAISLKARISQAGLTITPTVFWLASLGLGAGVFLFLFLQGRPLLITAGIAVAAALGLPRWVLGFLRGRRIKAFSAEFANAIDIITRGVKTGLPLGECLKIIAVEVPDPVGAEFKALVENVAVGVPMDEGLARMYERMPVPELNFFSIVLVIQQKTGGNLAETLSNLAVVLRGRKMMKEKISALSSEAKASAMIIGALPPLVMGIVYMTSPDYMTLMFTDRLGHFMMLGGAVWMGAGIFIMRRMINFKF